MTPPTDDRALRQDVAEVLVRYATSIDRKDWTRLGTCFTRDCRADYGDVGSWTGSDALVDFMARTHPEAVRTLHRITNVEVTPEGDGATARSYVDVIFVAADTGSGVQAAGTYDDELVRTEAGWRIARRRFRMAYRALLAGSP